MDYRPLYLKKHNEWRPIQVEDSNSQGKGIIIKLKDYDTRATATSLLGCEMAIRREQLPPLAPGEHYWTDLENLRVITQEGIELGKVQRLFETGANAVLVVTGERERLIPFLQGSVVETIDLDKGFIQVDWDPTF
jgi:16S rRNA processing protein RimM